MYTCLSQRGGSVSSMAPWRRNVAASVSCSINLNIHIQIHSG